MKYSLKKLIIRDLIFGFKKNKYKFIGLIIIFSIITWLNLLDITGQAKESGLHFNNINFVDLFFNLFKGSEYDISHIPINWFFIYTYITFLIGTYYYDDLSLASSHLIVRLENRMSIWISKIIWMICTIIFVYTILISIVVIFSSIYLNLDLTWGDFTKYMYPQIIHQMSSKTFIVFTIIIYILTSITISIFQMLISFIVKPKYIYLVNTVLLVLALCTKRFIIPIQGSLLLRQNIFEKSYSITPINSIIFNLLIILFIFICGLLSINKLDILESQETD